MSADPRPEVPIRPRDIWTRLAIDPVADPFARWLARQRGVTPNRVTAASGALGVAAVVCFAVGQPRAGGLLFLLRFFADCVDGKVARLQTTGSARGALFDVATDVGCVVASYAALGLWASRQGELSPGWLSALLVVVAWYSWALAHRKHLALLAGRGDGGSTLHAREDVALIGPWLAWCRRLHMCPVPWAVEVETLVLGLIPLLAPGLAGPGIVAAVGFYAVATVVNLRRMARLALLLDRPGARVVGDLP